MAYYKCGSIHPTQNSNVVVDTASGSIANFNTLLSLPLIETRFGVKAIQEAGTPTPQSPKAISGVNAVNVVHCGKNLVDIKPFNEWEFSNVYYLLFNCIPNKQVKMSFIDKDVDVDISDIYFGFVDSDYNKVSALTPQQYRWCLNQGNIVNNRTNLSTQGDNILTGLLIYPKTQDAFDRLFARYNIVVSVNDETSYEPYNGTTTLINLGGTYYGGYVSQDKDGKREGVIMHNVIDLGDLNYSSIPCLDSTKFRKSGLLPTNIKGMPTPSSTNTTSLCEIYTATIGDTLYLATTDGITLSTVGNVIIYDSRYNQNDDNEQFKLAVTGIKLVYPLAEPFTVVLPDGEPIKSLPGVNNIFCDTGDTSLQFAKIQAGS